MDDYIELAAYALNMPLFDWDGADADYDEWSAGVEDVLQDTWGIGSDVWQEIVDVLLPCTPMFPSALIPGEMIQAFMRPSDDGKASIGMVRRIIPPAKD